MCIKNKFTLQVEKEFSTSTFCGEIFSIYVYQDYIDRYNIFIKGLMRFRSIDGYGQNIAVGLSKSYSKEELENDNLRKHIIDSIDYELQQHIKKVKIKMFKQYPNIITIKFTKLKLSQHLK